MGNQINNDGRYTNTMTKFNTLRDSDTSFTFTAEPIVPDTKLTVLYEQSGLFAKIIDIPAEKAVSEGLNLDKLEGNVAEYITDKLDDLDWEENMATALKWSRLYGGAIAVMIVDDGGRLEDHLNINNVKDIEEIKVFERAVVQPDYVSMYRNRFNGNANSLEPDFYIVNSVSGMFKVHKSRCLVFKNGKMPELSSYEQYRMWGIPEYVRIKNELRRTVTSHESADKLLNKSVQPVHKIKNLSQSLATQQGEENLLKRLEAVDLARNMLNTIAIDSEGEDYAFATFSMTGVKDTVEVACNLISAITNIPQTILFGRSPSGMNSTGESDLENYYNFISQIQKTSLKRNTRRLLDIILRAGVRKGELTSIPKYKTEFNKLWSLSEKEQAELEKTKADTAKVKAETVQIYLTNQVLDVNEVRKDLAKTGEFIVENILDDELGGEDDFNKEIDETLENNQSDWQGILNPNSVQQSESDKSPKDLLLRSDADYDPSVASAVLLIKDGCFLVANRNDTGDICGPGGHIEPGETPLQAAVRETQEEFNIRPLKLMPLFKMDDLGEAYDYPVNVFLCQEFEGTPQTDEVEMTEARWMDIEQLLTSPNLFEPFKVSLIKFVAMLRGT